MLSMMELKTIWNSPILRKFRDHTGNLCRHYQLHTSFHMLLADVLPIYFPFMVHWMLQIPDVSVTVEKIPGGFRVGKGVFEKVA